MSDIPFPHDAALLSVKDVANFYRICPKTVRRWIASGQLPAIRLGRDWRIARDDLKRMAQSRGDRVIAAFL